MRGRGRRREGGERERVYVVKVVGFTGGQKPKEVLSPGGKSS